MKEADKMIAVIVAEWAAWKMCDGNFKENDSCSNKAPLANGGRTSRAAF